MQDINSEERYSQFTQAVIEAAEREATALLLGAAQEKEAIVRAAAHSVADEEIERLTAKSERLRATMGAEAAQQARKNLLLYREGLNEQLVGKVRARVAEFVASDAYAAFLKNKLAHFTDILKDKAAEISVRLEDEALMKKLCAAYPHVQVLADTDILAGGFSVCIKNKIYDETLDAGIAEEKERFLSYCGLKVV